ncbi:protein NLRC3 [Alosa pseudoharengus]|uniref:protein NLRC3 n=1 Tax=Alosa pseudoharengus TaxID=34774 RepID=UPI003F8B8B00
MAVGPFSEQVRESRVELVDAWSKHVTSLLDLLSQAGAITEEDVSLVRGGGCLGDRDRMRNLLDVLYGRGEDACCAFFKVMPRVQTASGTKNPNISIQPNLQEHLQRHREVLGKEHGPKHSGNIKAKAPDSRQAKPYTDITLSKRPGYEVHLQHQHEAAMVGESFRGHAEESKGQGEICVFREMYQSLLAVPGDGLTLLSGVAGSGKTTVVRRLVHEWSSQKDSKKIILSLSFRELNLLTEPDSLQGLLSMHYSHLKPVLTEIMGDKLERVLLILDGLDEFCFPLDFKRTPKCSDPERAMPVGAMVVNLLKGNLLPGISILLTSRPHAVSKVPPELVNVFCSVLGFTPAQQQEYFRHNCSSVQAGAQVWDYVSTHKPLQLMCHVPAFCWIVSTALYNGSPGLTQPVPAADNSKSVSENVTPSAPCIPTDPSAVLITSSVKTLTITDIYCCFLKSILVFHGEGREEDSRWRLLQDAPRILQESRPVLRGLGVLAFQGLVERRFLFDCADLDRAGLSLDRADVSRGVFLVEILKEDSTSLTLEKNFYFIHTSVQEFLAASYFVYESLSGSDPFAGQQPHTFKLPPALQRLMTSTSKKLLGAKGLLKRHVKKALLWSEQKQSGHMDLFCRFVSGLMVPRTRLTLDGLFPRTGSLFCSSSPSTPSTAPPFYLSLLHSQLQSCSLCPERQVNVCHCLYEAQDSGLSQRLQSWLQVLAQTQTPRSEHSSLEKKDWSELAFLLQLSPDLDTLKLDAQGLDAEGLRRLLPVLPLFRTLSLGQNPLGPEGAAVLSKALKTPACRVERLWVVKTGLGCEGVRILSDTLKDNRTVVDLRMAINDISDGGAGHLADLLKTNCALKDIRLRDNQITDKGAELLMDALTENSTLQYLWLFDNKFTKDGVKKLIEFSKTRTNLEIKVCV